jgi:hypothetical protein
VSITVSLQEVPAINRFLSQAATLKHRSINRPAFFKKVRLFPTPSQLAPMFEGEFSQWISH